MTPQEFRTGCREDGSPITPVKLVGESPKVAGAIYFVSIRIPLRWKPYKPNSEQVRRGQAGRWQKMNEYGGWENHNQGSSWEFGEYEIANPQ